MKKTLIAVAALAATSAFAQATVYGVVDMGYSTMKSVNGTTETKASGMRSIASGSRIGFKATEDLGSGLMANALMEMALAPDEATQSMANRQGYVGLSGAFGTVNLGRQYNLIHGVQAAQDPNGNATASGYLALMTTLVRTSNAIAYTSPAFSGFTVSAQYADGENTNGTTGNTTSIGANYANGPLTVGLAQETTKETALTVTLPSAAVTNGLGRAAGTAISDNLTDRVARSVGVGYNFGMAKVGFVNTSAEAGSSANAGNLKTNNLTVAVPMGKLTLGASMSTGTYVASGAAEQKLTGYQVGAYYALSKRTTVYANIGSAKADTTAESKEDSTAVGIRHTF